MVSSSLGIPLEELLGKLKRFRQEYANDPDYQQLRSALPAEYPL